ncbi:MAG TPA: hypothetical protein VFG55_07875 [Rhodanobacteraceae bacterium]|nr:hypothetical protein [Rhodanobacteraceae bacterium]
MTLRSALHTGILFCLLSVSTHAYALDEILSFRSSPLGGVEAVVSGLSDGPNCAPEFLPPASVQIEETSISIVSPEPPSGCFIPLPAEPYQIVAELGPLPGPRYDVTWTQDPLQVSGVLIPGDLASIYFPLPALSLWFLALLGFSFCVAGTIHLRAEMRSRRCARPAATRSPSGRYWRR